MIQAEVETLSSSASSIVYQVVSGLRKRAHFQLELNALSMRTAWAASAESSGTLNSTRPFNPLAFPPCESIKLSCFSYERMAILFSATSGSCKLSAVNVAVSECRQIPSSTSGEQTGLGIKMEFVGAGSVIAESDRQPIENWRFAATSGPGSSQ